MRTAAAVLLACLGPLVAPALTSAGARRAALPERAIMRTLRAHGYHDRSARCAARAGWRSWTCRWGARRGHGRARLRCAGLQRWRLVRSARGRPAARLRRRAVWRRCRPVDPQLEPLGPPHTAPHFGFNHEWRTDLPGAALARRAGADTGRMPVYWMQVERSPGRFDWRSYDLAYRALLAQGQRPIMIVMYAPCWARPSTPCPGAFGGYPPDAAYEPAWARFVRSVATRYPAARAIEVWNEPNFATFFHSPDPGRYARLLRQAFGAVKGVAPGLPVIGGSLAPARGWQRFLTRAFAAGAGEHMDGLGMHPYPRGDRIVTDLRRQVRDARRVLARRHERGCRSG